MVNVHEYFIALYHLKNVYNPGNHKSVYDKLEIFPHAHLCRLIRAGQLVAVTSGC